MRRTVAVLPLRDGRSGKTRLQDALSAADRALLVAELARHVAATLLGTDGVTRLLVVTADADAARRTLAPVRGPVLVLVQPPHRPGLNAALDVAREHVLAGDPGARLLVVHGDLPALTPDDVAAVLGVDAPLGLAPDRTGTGTNVLLLDRPAGFPFRFGPHSLRAHRAEAARRRWDHVELDRPGTAVDLDTPDDWAVLPHDVRARVTAAVPATALLPGPV